MEGAGAGRGVHSGSDAHGGGICSSLGNLEAASLVI